MNISPLNLQHGLYLDADSGGSGEPPDTSGDGAQTDSQVAELQQALDDAERRIKEIQSAQSGSDRRVGELTNELEQREQRIAELENQLDVMESGDEDRARLISDLKSQVEDLVKENRERTKREAQARWESQRTKLVTNEFPEFVSLLQPDDDGEDALPQAESIEELRKKLSRWKQSLDTSTQTTVQDTLSGGRPPTQPPGGGSGGQPSTDTIWNQYNKAVQSGDMERARELKQEWYDSIPE